MTGWEMALTIAGYAFKAYSAFQAGKAEARAAQIKARQAQLDAQAADIRGRQEALEIQKQAASVRSTNIARATGYDPYSSMSWMALDDDNEDEAENAATNAVANAQIDSSRFMVNAGLQREAARSANRRAYTGAASALFSGGLKVLEIS